MKDLIKKISSRKFLSCVAGVVIGVCMIFGLDENTVNTIAGALMASSSVIVYIYSEGKIDAAAVGKIKDAVDKVKDAVDAVTEVEE